jgi:hypothetical protein
MQKILEGAKLIAGIARAVREGKAVRGDFPCTF